jgi:hypothetical protein
MVNWQFGMKRKTEIQIAFVCHEYPKILHIKTTLSKEENVSAHWFFQPKKLLKAFRYKLKMLKVNFEHSFGFAKNACTHEFLGYQYEWQKLLEEKRRISANETAWNIRKWKDNK